jgi:hypothetical protein
MPLQLISCHASSRAPATRRRTIHDCHQTTIGEIRSVKAVCLSPWRATGRTHRRSCHDDRWCMRSGFSAVAAHRKTSSGSHQLGKTPTQRSRRSLSKSSFIRKLLGRSTRSDFVRLPKRRALLAPRPRRLVWGMARPTRLGSRDLIWRCRCLRSIESKRRTCDQDRRRDRRCRHNHPLV